jgi:hypothetical protein
MNSKGERRATLPLLLSLPVPIASACIIVHLLSPLNFVPFPNYLYQIVDICFTDKPTEQVIFSGNLSDMYLNVPDQYFGHRHPNRDLSLFSSVLLVTLTVVLSREIGCDFFFFFFFSSYSFFQIIVHNHPCISFYAKEVLDLMKT